MVQFSFSDDKNVLRPIWSVDPCKYIFVFWYYHMINNFEFRIFVIILNIKVNIGTWLNTGRFYLDCSMICLVLFIKYLIWLFYVHIIWYCSHMYVNFVFQSSDVLLQRQSFLHCMSSNIIITKHGFYWSNVKLTTFINSYLGCFTTRLI